MTNGSQVADVVQIDEQPHVPADDPAGTGGQWAEKTQSTPEAHLATVVGSFLFPPLNYGPNGVEDYIEFWESAPISDRVLSNLIEVYRANREEWLGAGLDRWSRIFSNSVETAEWLRKKKPDSNQIRDRHNAARLVELRRLEAERPTAVISSQTARSVARAAQMYRCAGALTDDDKALVDNHPVMMTRDSEPWTVKEIWTGFHLDEIDDRSLVDQDVSVTVELRELRKHFKAIDVI